MTDAPEVLFWRRTDVPGLERLELRASAEAVRAEATVIGIEGGGFPLDHRWLLSPDWRALSPEVERAGPATWRADRQPGPDLDGASEPDLSVTPFRNAVPIRRTPPTAGASLTLDTCFVDGAAMTVARSSQRHDRLGLDRLRYLDLGLAAGFEAELEVDGQGLVLRYEHPFERVAPA